MNKQSGIMTLTENEIKAIENEAERCYSNSNAGEYAKRGYRDGAMTHALKAKALIETFKNIQHHIDMWSDEPERIIRLVQKEIDAYNQRSVLSKAAPKGDDVKSKEEILADKFTHPKDHYWYRRVLAAMEEYASQFAAPQAVKWVQASDWPLKAIVTLRKFEKNEAKFPCFCISTYYANEETKMYRWEHAGIVDSLVRGSADYFEIIKSQEWLEGSTDKNETK